MAVTASIHGGGGKANVIVSMVWQATTPEFTGAGQSCRKDADRQVTLRWFLALPQRDAMADWRPWTVRETPGERI